MARRSGSGRTYLFATARRPMVGRALVALAMAQTLWGCAAHEVYEKPGLTPAMADEDWARCQAAALGAVGQANDVDALRGETTTSGQRLVGMMATLDVGNGTMYGPTDYLKITTRRDVLHACMQGKGYRFIGVPTVERL
jgi:hypothetical protein